jgi:hypothetical protein
VRFFSASSLVALMKAANIVLGDIDAYTGEIPERNIVEFKANFERLKPETKFTHYWVNGSRGQVIAYIPESIIKPDQIEFVQSGIGVAWTGNVLKVTTYNTGANDVMYSSSSHPLPPPALKICAPQKYFNMDGKEVDENNKIVDKPIDPMILMEYEGGYLVLTTWFN